MQHENERRGGGSSIAPTRTPTMAGGLFAVDRKYFWEIGSYDDEMEVRDIGFLKLAGRFILCCDLFLFRFGAGRTWRCRSACGSAAASWRPFPAPGSATSSAASTPTPSPGTRYGIFEALAWLEESNPRFCGNLASWELSIQRLLGRNRFM